MTTTNDWCRVLGIRPPKLEAVAGHREANTFALLLVALLERGEAMTLSEVAARFEEAGLMEQARARLSLSRCKPGRPPVYRDGDLYHLDPYDRELDFWAFRLDLRETEVQPAEPKDVEVVPPSGPEIPLTLSELDVAWRDRSVGLSAQRLAVAVLDAYGGPLAPAEVVQAVSSRTRWHRLTEVQPHFKRRGSPVEVLEDGRWRLSHEAGAIVRQTRANVRAQLAAAQRQAGMGTDPATLQARRVEREKARAARRAELARESTALLVAFPPAEPKVAVLLDVDAHAVTSFAGDELSELRSRLETYDVLGGVDVRGQLRALGFEPGPRRLAELGPSQKSMKLNQRGRSLKITTALLVQGSCGIAKPFGDEKKLAGYLANGELTRLRRRLEADLKSLYNLYEYGLLHGLLCLRWGFLDERIPAPWFQADGQTLRHLKETALAKNVPLEVVIGSAPGWDDPWSRARVAFPEKDAYGWPTWITDEEGSPIDEDAIQRARLAVTIH